MAKLELYVWLMIPDTTAITAFYTLKKMGFDVKSVRRKDYYSFEVDNNMVTEFSKKIGHIDILVNANKHRYLISGDKGVEMGEEKENKPGFVSVLVQDFEKPTGLLNTLKQRLGFSEIKDMEKGTLWQLECSKEDAEKIARELLCNENYQGFRVI